MKILSLLILSLSTLTLTYGQTSDAFSDAVDNGGGSYTNWFGTFTARSDIGTSPVYIDHEAHGLLYVNYSGEDVWLYDFNVASLGDPYSGWLYTSREIFPVFYVFAGDAVPVVYLDGVEGAGSSSRIFINADTLAPVVLSNRSSLDIVETAVGNGSFESLATALTTANLVSTIQNSTSLTVFAPTDDAFGKIDSEVLNGLLTDAEQLDDLTDILTYHVVAGELSASDLGFDIDDIFAGESSVKYLETLNGSLIKVQATPFGVMINDTSMVTTANLETSNGLIHVIDTVLMPPQDIVDTAVNAGLSLLATTVTEADLISTLRGAGPFTVFAPVDSAFQALGQDTLDNLLADENIDQLRDILLYHVVSGAAVFSSEVEAGLVTMANGDQAEITSDVDGKLFINGAEIIATDVNTSNGVVHLIDEVILPPSDAN